MALGETYTRDELADILRALNLAQPHGMVVSATSYDAGYADGFSRALQCMAVAVGINGGHHEPVHDRQLLASLATRAPEHSVR